MRYSASDPLDNNTEVCQNNRMYCFAVWSTRKLPDNTTVGVVIRKGCFTISFEMPNTEHPCGNQCIQSPVYDAMGRNKNVSGFCCCDTNYCNTNFTMTEYDFNGTPSPTKQPGLFS
jgi:hypothetical protein